ETLICRDGHGSGMGTGSSPGEAHETAVKEAETDATKRALVTFGNAFGLCLYDREQKQVRRRRKAQNQGAPTEWPLRSATGEVIKTYGDPAPFCSALRKSLEGCTMATDLTALWTQHAAVLAPLQQLPQLKSERGEHYAEILAGLYGKRLQELERREETHSDGFPALRPRRVRDKAHLRRVAQQPCLICGRLPAH